MKPIVLTSLAVVTLCALPLTTAASDESKASANGRYEGVAASATAVWVIDTRTGRVRKCTQEFADQTPRCSQPSN